MRQRTSACRKNRPRIRVSAKEERTVDGIVFASKAEARYYCELKLLVKAGRVLWFIRQPSFDLPGGVKYRADFLVVERRMVGDYPGSTETDTVVRVIDVKGHRTQMYKLKRKQVEAIYGITIEEVKA